MNSVQKKIESHLSYFITYDLQTHKADRARLYVFCFYRLSELAGKHDRHNLPPYEIDNCKKDTLVFDGENLLQML